MGGLTVSTSKFELGFIPVRGRTHYWPIATDDVRVVRFELVVDGAVVASDDDPTVYDVPRLENPRRAQRLYWDVDYRGGAAIVLGSEASGLSDLWAGNAVTAVKLPMNAERTMMSGLTYFAPSM